MSHQIGNLKIGDVVRLKSGGPPMTVQDIGSFPHNGFEIGVRCVWFDDKRQRVQELFHPQTLESAFED